MISLQSCGNAGQPPVEVIRFDDASVSFQNTSCSTGFTLINTSNQGYTLALLTAAFEDENGQTYNVELNQEEVIENFDSVVIPPTGNTHADVTFDLQSANLTPPIRGTVIVVGLAQNQVVHFVGDFTCQ